MPTLVIEDANLPQLFCPACGARVFHEDGYEDDLCVHVLFVWLANVDQLERVSPHIAPLVEELEADPDWRFTPDDDELTSRLPETTALICLVDEGRATGLVSGTKVVAFDFGAADEDL